MEYLRSLYPTMALAKEWGFQHVTSSPHYPQSNGLAGKYVQICKNVLLKAERDGRDLLEYRNTPLDGTASPAQLLMSRRLRSILPSTGKQLQPKTVHPKVIQTRRHQQQHTHKYYYDQQAVPLPPLRRGESIRVQKIGMWQLAVVTSAASTPRSYHVRTEDGGHYTRNRRHLLKTKERHTFPHLSVQQDVQNRPSTPPLQVTPSTRPAEAATTTPPAVPPSPTTPACPAPYTTRYGRTITPRRLMDV